MTGVWCWTCMGPGEKGCQSRGPWREVQRGLSGLFPVQASLGV